LVWVFLSIYFEKSSFCLKESSEKKRNKKKERNENEQLPPTEHVISSVHNIADRPQLRITELPHPPPPPVAMFQPQFLIEHHIFFLS
jgi:hypothetical protein